MAASLSPYLIKNMLDFVGGAAASVQPSERWLGLLNVDGTEFSFSGYTRQSAVFDEAGSPIATLSIATALTFGSYSGAGPQSVFGIALFDASASGNQLFSGSLMTVRTIPDPGTLVVHALNVTLA